MSEQENVVGAPVETSEPESVTTEVTPEDSGQNDFLAEVTAIAEARADEEEKTKSEPEGAEETPSEEPENKTQPGDATVDDAGKDKPDDSEDKSTIDDGLIERAVRAGLSMSDAKGITDNAVLNRLVDRLEADSQSKLAGDEKPAGEEKSEEDLLSKIPDLDPDEYDEDIVTAMSSLKDVVKQQQELISSLRQDKDGAEQSQKDREFTSWIDGQFAGLGKDYESTFGKGGIAGLGGDSHANRVKLARHLGVVEVDLEAAGKEIPGREELFGLALKSAFGDVVNDLKGKAVAAKSAARSRRVVNQPRNASGSFIAEASSEEALHAAAVAEVEKYMDMGG